MPCVLVFFFKQKTAYEMRISDWSSDVCSSDLIERRQALGQHAVQGEAGIGRRLLHEGAAGVHHVGDVDSLLVQLHAPRLDLREVEDVADDRQQMAGAAAEDRKSTRLNSSH